MTKKFPPPPEKPLGEPRREFWETFSAAEMIVSQLESNASKIPGGQCVHGTPLSWHCEECFDEHGRKL